MSRQSVRRRGVAWEASSRMSSFHPPSKRIGTFLRGRVCALRPGGESGCWVYDKTVVVDYEAPEGCDSQCEWLE